MISPGLEQKIMMNLPYGKSFLFVDRINQIDENEITGTFQFPETADYYQGHFTKKAITPGVLLLETMGQIGLVCFGIFLLKIHETGQSFMPILSHLDSDFIGMVLPGEKVTVHSQKKYFRNNILKCKITMLDSANNIILTTTAICSFKMEKE
jgi:3-hydroxyacyl-[acyl-carrier-protein] dehydratase